MIVPDLSVYKNKMGGGCIDALKLLLAIKGTPAVYVKTGEAVTVDFSRYFGGDKSVVTLESTAKLASPGNLGLSSASVSVVGTKITFNCPKTAPRCLRSPLRPAIRLLNGSSPSSLGPTWPATAAGSKGLSVR